MNLLEACGVQPAAPFAENAPLETTTIRLTTTPSICLGPQYLAGDLLKRDGFTDTRALDPARAAKFLVDNGCTNNYDYALEAMQNIPYNRWQEYDPEDTVIFYTNRLRDAGLIKGNANDIVATGTDWHFLNELKQEMKG